MKDRRILALVVGTLGIAFSGFSVYAANYLAGIKGKIVTFDKLTGDNSVGNFLGDAATKKVDSYGGLIAGCFWLGIVLILVGVIMFIIFNKKKKR